MINAKARYRQARSIIRANGRMGLRWIAPDLREAMNHWLDEYQCVDLLATRQRMMAKRTTTSRLEVVLLTCPSGILFKYQAW